MAEDKRYRRDYPKLTDEQKQLVEDNMRLVYKVATEVYQGVYEYDDLVQMGSLGLCLAAIDYDPDKGVAFSTFATTCIKRAIFRHNQIMTKKKRDHRLEAYSLDELAHMRRGDDFSTHLDELVGYGTVEDTVIAHELIGVVNGLRKQRRDVLWAHMRGCTLAEIGQEFGFSRARAGQILYDAKRDMRERWRA